MAIFESHEIKQERGETLNAFYRRLKEKATRYEFHDEDREIKTHIIHKTTDSHLRRKALRETMTLNELLTYGNTLEKTDIESKKIERTQESSSPSNQAYSLHNKQRHQQQRSRYNAQAKNQQKTPSGTRHPAMSKLRRTISTRRRQNKMPCIRQNLPSMQQNRSFRQALFIWA